MSVDARPVRGGMTPRLPIGSTRGSRERTAPNVLRVVVVSLLMVPFRFRLLLWPRPLGWLSLHC